MSARIACLLLCCSLLICGCAEPVVSPPAVTTVLIDPGHGGFDGGTSSADGTAEKDINLFISLYLRDMLRVCGVAVSMTRETDTSTTLSEDDSIRNRKISDMQNRLTMYEHASLIISIHQNHFSVPKYHGTQVFYSNNHADSVRVAEAMQQSVRTFLQQDNTRQIKAATNGIYLLHHTTVPAVLVGCGFLSNEEEAALLKSDDYRRQMAWTLFLGFFQFMTEE